MADLRKKLIKRIAILGVEDRPLPGRDDGSFKLRSETCDRVDSRNHLTLRRAEAKDADFAFQVLKETMRDYAIATWGTWLEEQSRRETVEQVAAGRTEVIELNQVPIGVQLVDRQGKHIQLVQLYIAKKFQRRGFGMQLVERLFAEAREAKLPIRLRVLAVNPARAFYERLGFNVVETSPERYFMEWRP